MTISDVKRFAYKVESTLKTEFTLDFSNSLTRAEEFVAEISQIKSDIDAKHGATTMDAKSFVGFVGTSNSPLQVIINSINDEDLKLFNEICKKYEVKKND